jgi:hypothetical protein
MVSAQPNNFGCRLKSSSSCKASKIKSGEILVFGILKSNLAIGNQNRCRAWNWIKISWVQNWTYHDRFLLNQYNYRYYESSNRFSFLYQILWIQTYRTVRSHCKLPKSDCNTPTSNNWRTISVHRFLNGLCRIPYIKYACNHTSFGEIRVTLATCSTVTPLSIV